MVLKLEEATFAVDAENCASFDKTIYQPKGEFMKTAEYAFAALALSLSAPAFACMETFTDSEGTWLRNDCGRAVSYSFCFGNGCTPPGDEQAVFTAVRSGNAKLQISRRQRDDVVIRSCILPRRLKGGECA